MRRVKSREYAGVTFERVAAEGMCLARVEGRVLFAPFAVPGDVATVRAASRRGVLQGRIVSLETPSPHRIEPTCKNYGLCGGCQWQCIPYEMELVAKGEQVAEQLSRIGHLELPPLEPILGSLEQEWYRNKMEYTFSPRVWQEEAPAEGEAGKPGIGFHLPGRFDRILPIEECRLQPEPANDIRNTILELSIHYGLSYYNPRSQAGQLRTLMLRCNRKGEFLVLITFHHELGEGERQLMGDLVARFPQIVSLAWVVNPKVNDTIYDLEVKLFHGEEYIEEEMSGLTFAVGPKSFYQTNSRQAERLYGVVREFAGMKGGILYDLYCGTGTIGLFLAEDAERVVGIESVGEAVEDAQRNALRNGIENAHFVAGDVQRILNKEFVAKYGHPDCVVTDPPRAGMHPEVVERLMKIAPERIVYVSCNPATQARDLALMAPAYEVVRVRPVDMFPRTKHVESVVLLRRRMAVSETL